MDKQCVAPDKKTIEELKKNYEKNLTESMDRYQKRMKELAKNKRTVKII